MKTNHIQDYKSSLLLTNEITIEPTKIIDKSVGLAKKSEISFTWEEQKEEARAHHLLQKGEKKQIRWGRALEVSVLLLIRKDKSTSFKTSELRAIPPLFIQDAVLKTLGVLAHVIWRRIFLISREFIVRQQEDYIFSPQKNKEF